MKKIFITITTTHGSDWRGKLKEIERFKLKEVALFLAGLELKEREELYELIKKSSIERIPLVHLRSDMESWELDYLFKNYKVQVFNVHSQSERVLSFDYSKYRDITYIENTHRLFDENELKDFAGISLDLSHLENSRLLDKKAFQYLTKIIEEYPIGSNHVSAIKKDYYKNERNEIRYDCHYLSTFSELDYLKRYPSNYFSSFIAIELENTISEQLKIKDYLEKLLFL